MDRLSKKIKQWIKLASLIGLASFPSDTKAQMWEQVSQGFEPSRVPRCMLYDEVNDLLFLGGDFKYSFDGQILPSIAIWDGNTLSPFGCGFNWSCDTEEAPENGHTNDLIFYQDTIYAIGLTLEFSGTTPLNGIAKWDGDEWLAVGNLPDATRLSVANDTLFAHGASQVPEENIDGLAWWCVEENKWKAYHDLPNLWGDGDPNFVLDIEYFEGEMYVGGNFYDSQTGIRDLIKWTGSEWVGVSGLCGGLSAVQDMAIFQEKLIVAGNFYLGNCAGNPGNYIASFDGTNWSAMGTGMDAQVNYLVATDDYLYAAGAFFEVNSEPSELLARWDGQQWCGYGSSGNFNYFDEPSITAIGIANGELLVAGGFEDVDGEPLRHLIKYIGPDSCLISDVSEHVLSDFSVYPNPVNDVLSISGISPNDKTTIKITDSTGRIVMTKYNQQQIDVAHLPSGIYFIEVSADESRAVLRFVKE